MSSFDPFEYVDTERGLVRGEIFHSQEIYDRELEFVFGRSWLFLAHDSMIRKPGDFIQTYMGEDPVVVARQKDGSVRAFLNQCRHRGMRICRADLGNAKAFMCSFHGWTYGVDGSLLHVPHEEEAYTEPLDKTQLGATRVTQLFNYKGFIFGNWDPEAPDFLDYLGDMAWYFDAYIDRYEGGLEVIGTHKWIIPCNWKFNAEQPSSDGYHAEFSHASALQVLGGIGVPDLDGSGQPTVGGPPPPMDGGPIGAQFTSPYGHGTGFFHGDPNPLAGQHEKAWVASRRDETVARVGELRADSVRGHANIFPTFMFLPNGAMRVTHPRGPDEMEIWGWTFVPVEAPDEVKQEIRVGVVRTFSPGGLFEQDDAENWVEEQRILRGHKARQNSLLYNMQLGRSQLDAGDLPGETVDHIYTDLGARGLYQHWADLMTGDPWPTIEKTKRGRGPERLLTREAREAATEEREGASP